MVKKLEAYRGEDKTLELIRSRVTQMEETEPGALEACEYAKWNIACERVYLDFIKEGLTQSANEVLKHVHGQPDWYLKTLSGKTPWVDDATRNWPDIVKSKTATPIRDDQFQSEDYQEIITNNILDKLGGFD